MAARQTQTYLAVGGAVALALLIGAVASASGPKKPKRCDPKPFSFPTREQIATLVQSAINAGWRDKAAVINYVVKTFAPNIGPLPPPIGNAAARCLYDEVSTMVDLYLKGQDIPPWPDCAPGTTLNAPQAQCVPGIDVKKYEDEFGEPRHGTMFQAVYGDRLLGEWVPGDPREKGELRSVVYGALYTAAYEAAIEVGGLSPAEAHEYAEGIAKDNGLRWDYLQLAQCVKFNDAHFQTYGYGGQSVPGPNGRALRFLPYHYDVRKQLQTGKPTRRNIPVGVPADAKEGNAGKINSGQNSFEYIWLPELSRVALWNDREITTNGPDVEFGLNPPPEITAVGLPEPPQGVSWGCG